MQVTGDLLQCFGETQRRIETESGTLLRNVYTSYTVTREPQHEDENSPRHVTSTSVCSVTSPKLLLGLPDR